MIDKLPVDVIEKVYDCFISFLDTPLGFVLIGFIIVALTIRMFGFLISNAR